MYYRGLKVFSAKSIFAFTLLLGLTHIYSALLIISQLIYILYQLFKHKDRKPDLLAVAVINLLALGISCVFYGYLIYLCMGILLSSSTDMAYSVFPAIAKPFLFLFVLSLGETLAPWNISVIPSMIAFGYLAFIAARRMNEGVNALMLLCVFLPIIVAAFFLKPSMPKYLLSTLPFYLVLLSGQLTFVTRRLALAALAVIIFSSMVSVFNYYSLTDYHNSNQVEPWREVSGLIRDNYDKQDAIIVTNTALIKGALDYYLSNGDKTSRYRIYNLEDGINALSAKRIWLISHIADDRNLPPGEKQIMLSLLHDRKYKKQSTFSYIPYEKTLVSKLPIKRHVEGSYSITIDLYTAQ